MARRFFSLLLIGVFSMMLAGPALALFLQEHDHDPSVLHHGDGAPCPDNEGPCDSSCPCLCCPGHASVIFPAAFADTRSIMLKPHCFEPLEAVLPDGTFCRVFRPPRL